MSLLDRIPMPADPMDSLLNSTAMFQNILQKHKMSQLPFGGRIPPGEAGKVVGLEMVKRLYGENSPQYMQAKSMSDLNQESARSRINYQNILSNTAPKRFSTNFGKTLQELEDINKGNFPGTNSPIEENQGKENLKNQYELQILKSVSDPKTRERLIYSTNIDKTLDQLDPVALTGYSGVPGKAELLKDQMMASFGNPSEKYSAYTNALQSADLLAKQVRQFYGDSITPGVQEGLKKLTNPSIWSKDPKTALENFNKFVQILKSEQQTFTDAMTKSSTFTGKKQPKSYQDFANLENPMEFDQENDMDQPKKIEKTKEINGQQYVFFDNSWHKVVR